MDDASSAYDSAENVQATAASTKERMTAGPAMPAPLPITTKMPVPMMAPTPIAVSWVAPTAFLSPCPSSEVSVIRDRTSRIAKMPGRPDVVAICPAHPSLGLATTNVKLVSDGPITQPGKRYWVVLARTG